MGKENITFDNIEVEKHEFHWHKSPISINDVDVSKVLVSNKVAFGEKGFKYFIGYKDGRNFRPLCVILPKLNSCIRNFDKLNTSFLR